MHREAKRLVLQDCRKRHGLNSHLISLITKPTNKTCHSEPAAFSRRVRNLLFETIAHTTTSERQHSHLILAITNPLTQTCHSERSGAAFSSSFAPANEPRHAVEESLFDPSRSQVPSFCRIADRGRVGTFS